MSKPNRTFYHPSQYPCVWEKSISIFNIENVQTCKQNVTMPTMLVNPKIKAL
jgi:hypothetical protein